MENQVIYLSVSDVAAAIGQNPYSRPEVIARKILTGQFNIDENKSLTKVENVLKTVLLLPSTEIVEIAKSKMENVENLEHVNEEISKTSAQVEKQVRELVKEMVIKEKSEIKEQDPEKKLVIEQEIEKKIAGECKSILAELPKMIAGKVSQTTGILAESKIVDKVETETKIVVKDRNCVVKYLYVPIPGSEFVIKIGGKPDGTQTDPISKKVTIVEAKNRQNRLFDKIPPYEQVNVMLYMRLWKAETCRFIQNYRGDSRTDTIKFSAKKYQDIETKLIDFCKKHVVTKLQKNML